jgi:hypothetical protein
MSFDRFLFAERVDAAAATPLIDAIIIDTLIFSLIAFHIHILSIIAAHAIITLLLLILAFTLLFSHEMMPLMNIDYAIAAIDIFIIIDID